MSISERINKGLTRTKRISFYCGIILILLSLPSLFLETKKFLHAYLCAYLFWLELTLGSMAMIMIYLLTRGGWGAVTRRILEASINTIYMMALAFIPILLGFKEIYPWADPLKFKLNEFAHKWIYFDHTFFIWRSIFYVLSWVLLAYVLVRCLNKSASGSIEQKTLKLSAFGLVYLGLSVTWAAVDWQMSLDPMWRSTIYGLVFLVGQAMGAWAFTLLILNIILRYYQDVMVMSKKIDLDLANILLTIVILWAYVSFAQYLIVWSGNLPDEAVWYVKRMHHGWQWLMLAIFGFLFAVPFLALLFRVLKRTSWSMITLMALILAFRILERYWMIKPSYSPEAISVSYVDVTLMLGMGALWFSLFLRGLSKHSLFAVNDPNWPKGHQVLLHVENAA